MQTLTTVEANLNQNEYVNTRSKPNRLDDREEEYNFQLLSIWKSQEMYQEYQECGRSLVFNKLELISTSCL